MTPLIARPLEAGSFWAYGEVIEVGGAHKLINEGLCRRFDTQARPEARSGRIGISIFQAEIRPLPHKLTLMERHPEGSQCFVPMGGQYLVIVAPDKGGVPGTPEAFVAHEGQAVNYGRNVWHGVLAPISGSGLFTVIDRVGEGENLQEHHLATGYLVGLEP